MLSSSTHRNYLSRLAFAGDNPEPVFTRVNLVARALCPVKGVKSFAAHQVRIVSISEAAAVLQARNIELLTDHFYLCLGKFEIFLTCARVRAQEGSLFVRFSKPEETSFIRALSEITFPMTTLEKLRGHSVRVIEARIRQPETAA
ncbi:hypothetical protein [Rhizobium sp. BG4]|uniref:hypothetical protein n=1 Tax=Rhizobium sp. BG4 TaxID=2613770 RepID=UPI00193DA4C1|nr:hypothetical protein [Rhizobium sp. BG4]QRM44584.1 hypothetical protein F2982_14715 [Rhizobium sp. BG4]